MKTPGVYPPFRIRDLLEAVVKTGSACIVFLSMTFGLTAQQQGFDGRSWWHHIEVLAADDMEGRVMQVRSTGSSPTDRRDFLVRANQDAVFDLVADVVQQALGLTRGLPLHERF